MSARPAGKGFAGARAAQALGRLFGGDLRADGIRAGCAAAYIKGAFLGGGSCILPGKEGGKTGYHLEFVFPARRAASDFRRLLEENDLLAKVVERKDTAVVYIKSKETISDFLSAIGAESALKKFAEFVEKRDEANRSNRRRQLLFGQRGQIGVRGRAAGDGDPPPGGGGAGLGGRGIEGDGGGAAALALPLFAGAGRPGWA